MLPESSGAVLNESALNRTFLLNLSGIQSRGWDGIRFAIDLALTLCRRRGYLVRLDPQPPSRLNSSLLPAGKTGGHSGKSAEVASKVTLVREPDCLSNLG